jgi:UDP:flavonoid glycosyltransferase YjiC (YdhE family)
MSSLLLCSTPVHGHVTPLLAVARHLIGSGHRVRFLTGRRYRDAVEATGAEWLPLPDEADYDDRDMNASFPGRVGRSGPDGIRWDMREIFLKPAPAQLAAVDAAIAAEPVDAVIVETMFIGSLLFLARGGERPPLITLGIVPLGVRSRDTAPFGLGVLPMKGPIGRMRNSVLGFVAGNIIFGPVQKDAVAIVKEATGADLKVPFLETSALADALVQFTVPSFEYPRSDLPGHVHFVGPVSRTTASNTALPEWWSDLESGKPVVHVTQGTVANADFAELIDPTIQGLANDDVLIVVSTGGRDVPVRDYPANVRIAPYLPYDKLLPLTDVYITNGGYGGVHYAMEHGVPIVVAGRTEDKVEVSARIDWSGVGIDLRSNRPTPTQVRDAVRRVLAEPSFRQRSTAIGHDIIASPGLDGLEVVLSQVIARGARTV